MSYSLNEFNQLQVTLVYVSFFIIIVKCLVFILQNISLKDLQNCISTLFVGDHYFVQYELM